jgi:Skp family chaperone for outer membrane proteins
MPRTKGSKNKPKTVTADFATQIAEKQSAKEALTAEIASITANIDTLKADLKEKKTALKKTQKEVATLEAKKAKADAYRWYVPRCMVMRFYYKVSNMFKKLKGEINMKKFLSALMAIVLAISTALAASAAFDSRTAENSTVEIPTLYFDSAEAYERHLNQLKSDVSTHANGNAVISAAVVRSGSSEDCELYIEWDGNAVYSSFRYKQITVKTTSMLGDEKPYATFGTGRHFVTRPATAGMTGSVKIGDFKLSSDINKVIVKSSSLQAYNLTKATWQSSIEFSGMVWVK